MRTWLRCGCSIRAGDLTTYRAADGQLLASTSLSKQPVTAISNNRGDIAIGHGDGTIIVGRVSQTFNYLDPKGLPDERSDLCCRDNRLSSRTAWPR